MHIGWVPDIHRDDHSYVIELVEEPTLLISERRPVGTVQRGQLYIEKREVSLSPLLSPFADKKLENIAVLDDSLWRLGV